MIGTQLERLKACATLGYDNVSVEADGTCWAGTEYDRTFIDDAIVDAEVQRVWADRETRKQELLARLGLTEAEAKLLLS